MLIVTLTPRKRFEGKAWYSMIIWECTDHDQGVPGSLCPLLYKASVKDKNMDLDVED